MLNPIFIRQVSPVTEFGTYYAKSCVDTSLEFEYDLVGEPKLPRKAILLLLDNSQFAEFLDNPSAIPWPRFDSLLSIGMYEGVNDRYVASWVPSATGLFSPVVYAWVDEVDRLSNLSQRKITLGDSVELELLDLAAFFERHLDDEELLSWPTEPSLHLNPISNVNTSICSQRAAKFKKLILNLRDERMSQVDRLNLVLDEDMTPWIHLPQRVELVSLHVGQAIRVERERAGFSSWYELFPRSYGGFTKLTSELDRVASMGFDVVYFPPIHPIGERNRKGRNNSLQAEPDDVGSPWAIGSILGGHKTLHPQLGTMDDFLQILEYASQKGVEVAIDIALQCAPDHPWVTEHPEWFIHRANGEIAYAENPPKKYQDIYPINFYIQNDTSRMSLWTEIYDIFCYWISCGIQIFRVDNPHTKALAFWEWLCTKLLEEHPDVILLAEAFTAPKLMYRLAEIGFSQSYTYFTWRTNKYELAQYGAELAEPTISATMRPNFWPNTPDILAYPLREGNRSEFFIRATLAATMTTSWGVYSGFELFENMPVTTNSEEYLDSEKYQLRPRDYSQDQSLAGYISLLNELRYRNTAFRNQRGYLNVETDSHEVLAYLRFDPVRNNHVLVIVNLNSSELRECQINLGVLRDKFSFGETVRVRDALTGDIFTWNGASAYVRLDPQINVAHILEFL